MGIPLIRYSYHGQKEQWGVVDDDRIWPLQGRYPTLRDLILTGREEAFRQQAPSGEAISRGDVTLLCPITSPARLLCQGLNYREHREEVGQEGQQLDATLIFAKDHSTLSPADTGIVKPDSVELLDYEIELGLVLGRDIKGPLDVTDDNLHEYIAGLVICNDVSSRDDQFGGSFIQWFEGKNYRTFCPAGPIFYWLDEADFPSLYDLHLELKVNGDVRQSANTRQLIYRPPQTLSQISKNIDLNIGDCLLTGTPGGVALSIDEACATLIATQLFDEKARRIGFIENQRRNPNYLHRGDSLCLSIRSPDGRIDLGTQHSTVL